MVLCHLEGLSHEQSASRLGCPLRTLQSRLLRARARLRERLTRRGMSLPAVVPPLVKPVSPPFGWIDATSRAARAFATGRPATAASLRASPAAATLAEFDLRTAMMVPMMTAAAVALHSVSGCADRGLDARRDRGRSASCSFELQHAACTGSEEIDSENRTLEIRVVDRQSKAPIEKVEVSVDTDSGARPGFGGEPELMTRLVTDNDGKCRVEFPRELPKEIYITARKPGYAIRSYAPLTESVPGAAADSYDGAGARDLDRRFCETPRRAANQRGDRHHHVPSRC